MNIKKQKTIGPWCHRLRAVQMNAYLSYCMWIIECLGFLALYQKICCGSGSQAWNSTIRTWHSKSKNGSFFYSTEDIHYKFAPLTSTCTTAIVCKCRASIYWYFPLCFWQLSSLCVSINVLHSPLWILICVCSIKQNVCTITIRLIGLAQKVFVSWWKRNRLQPWCIHKSARLRFILALILVFQ